MKSHDIKVRGDRMSGISKALLFAVIAAAIPSPSSHARAVELEARPYVVGNRIEAWYKPVINPPKGWIENEEWTEKYERLVLFENGDMSSSSPMMYLRAHLAEDQPLDGYIGGAQERWKSKVPDASIEPLPDIERPGKPPIKMFLYKNPSHPEQAFELTAFVKETEPTHPQNAVFLQGVLLGSNPEIIEKARPAFLELLRNIR